MNNSEQINEVVAALSKAQGEYLPVVKDRTAKVKGESKTGSKYEYEYKYADLADVLAMALPILSKHGLSLSQPTFLLDNAMYIRTFLYHSSGQYLSSDYPIASISGDHQKMGGALSYGRRYSACTMLGIMAEEDKDGEGAELPDKQGTKPVPKTAPKPISITLPPGPPIVVTSKLPAKPPAQTAKPEVADYESLRKKFMNDCEGLGDYNEVLNIFNVYFHKEVFDNLMPPDQEDLLGIMRTFERALSQA